MSSANTVSQSRLIVIVLWGLVFAKCLTLEYLIQVYSIPVNSLIYIWALTLIMASTATIVFFRTQTTKINQQKSVSATSLIWCGCGVAGILLVGILYLLTDLNPYVIPTIISSLLGIGYLIHGIFIRKNLYIFNGIAWWIGAAALAAHNNLESLSIFAFLVIFLFVLPLIIEIRQQRKLLT